MNGFRYLNEQSPHALLFSNCIYSYTQSLFKRVLSHIPYSLPAVGPRRFFRIRQRPTMMLCSSRLKLADRSILDIEIRLRRGLSNRLDFNQNLQAGER